MTGPAPHPLQTYLDAHGEKGHIFANRTGLTTSTVYKVLAQMDGNMRLATLIAIQSATDGEVSAVKLIEWYIHNLIERSTYD